MSWKVVRTNGLAFNSPFAPNAAFGGKPKAAAKAKVQGGCEQNIVTKLIGQVYVRQK